MRVLVLSPFNIHLTIELLLTPRWGTLRAPAAALVAVHALRTSSCYINEYFLWAPPSQTTTKAYRMYTVAYNRRDHRPPRNDTFRCQASLTPHSTLPLPLRPLTLATPKLTTTRTRKQRGPNGKGQVSPPRPGPRPKQETRGTAPRPPRFPKHRHRPAMSRVAEVRRTPPLLTAVSAGERRRYRRVLLRALAWCAAVCHDWS